MTNFGDAYATSGEFSVGHIAVTDGLSELHWRTLVGRSRQGVARPFSVPGPRIPAYRRGELARRWATSPDFAVYPFPDATNLPRVAQYRWIQADDRVLVQSEVCDILKNWTVGQQVAHDIYEFLAKLPISVYLTTNYDDYMEQAIQKTGLRQPKVACCKWNSWLQRFYSSDLDNEPSYRPTTESPLVYHFHGVWHEPQSVVISEEDYIDFLARLKVGTVIDPAVERAAVSNTLMFIGYSHADINIHVMFQLLRNDIDKSRRKKSYTVQLDPAILDPEAFDDDVDGARRRTVLSYVEKLMRSREANVYWGTAADFCRDLVLHYDA